MARRPSNRDRPDDHRRPVFEFCLAGQPISGQAENRKLLQEWKSKVHEAAKAAWPASRPPMTVDVELRVTQYSQSRVGDRDNFIKPIQDALQSVAYVNDRQVKDAHANWRNINGRFTVRYISPRLAAAFVRGDEFIHIRLWICSDEEDLG